MAKKSVNSKMKEAQKKMLDAMSQNKEPLLKKESTKKKSKTTKEQYKELRESFKDPIVTLSDTYEEDLIKSLFQDNSIKNEETIDKSEESGDKGQENTIVKHRSGLWDYVLEDEITFFDPKCSYELTGYRCIDETHGLDFDPDPFCETGRIYTETGKYTEYPVGSKYYADFWMEQLRRCTEGYTINGYRITPDHYFFLNFYRMNIVDETKKAASGDSEGFPKFLVEQYKFFHYFEMCEYLKKDVVALKSRGIGWSEIGACLAVRPFITQRNFNSTFIASALNFLEPTLDKCWRQLNFLNGETNGGFRRPMMVINNTMHKRTSKQDTERREFGRKNDIEGIIADNTNKVRGRRIDRLMWEESGSFPSLRTAWTKGEALVTVAGARKGIMSAWGCVCKGTKVFRADGTSCNIENLKQDDGIIGFKEGKSNIEPITYMQEEAYKPCVRITTSFGELECSEDHPIYIRKFTNHRDGPKRWKEYYHEFVPAKDIMYYSTNNAVAVCDKIDVWGEGTLFDPYLIGLLIGDGSYGFNKTPKLFNCDDIINKYIDDNYNTIIEREYLTKDNKKYRESRIKGICKNLREIGIYGQTKTNKRLPIQYDKLCKKDSALLIAGLFDTDGYISENSMSISITQSSIELLNQIKWVLRKFGIFSNIHAVKSKIANRKNKNSYYTLNICDTQSVYNFYKNIPLKVDYKIANLANQVSNINTSNFSNIRDITVKSIEHIGIQRIYNLTAGDSHTYLANDIITHNTGGDHDSRALAGLSEMFNDPNAFNVLPYKNNYSEDGEIQYTGYFIPAYNIMLKSGFTDHRGVTNIKKAKEYYEGERKKKSGQALLEYCAEYCWTPNEALLKQGDGIFDPIIIADRLTQLRIQKVGIKPQQCDLLWDVPKGSENNPRNKVKLIPNTQGKVFIYEPPLKDENGNPYKNLYVAGIDSIDQGRADSSTNTDVSDFCIVIKKRILGSNSSNYVAIYKDRPRDIVTAYENAMKLLVYYNCKAMLEHTKISIIMYFRSKKKDNLFMTRPKSTMPDIRKGNSTMIGYPATETYLRHGLELINRFVDESCYSIQIDEMLEQLLKYSWENKRKFDIVAAMIAAELGDEDLLGFTPKSQNELKNEWKDFGWYYDSYGIKRYGILP